MVASNQDLTDEEYKVLLLDLEQHVQSQLDESHWLRQRVCFVEDLPKSQAGKVLKKKLRDTVTKYDLKTMEAGARMKFEY